VTRARRGQAIAAAAKSLHPWILPLNLTHEFSQASARLPAPARYLLRGHLQVLYMLV